MKKRNFLVIIAFLFMILPYFINYYTSLRFLIYLLGLFIFLIILFKNKRNIIINIVIVLTIFISSYFMDFILCYKERIPFMSKKVISSEKVTTYYSFLYQINICDKNWKIDKFYKDGYTCENDFLKEISVNEFLSFYESDKNSYLKIKGKISQIVGEKYIELEPYENDQIEQNGNVIFKEDIVLRLPIKDLNVDLKKYKIYDEIEFIGRVSEELKEQDVNVYLFTDVLIYETNLYDTFEIIVENDNKCEYDKTEYLKINDITYFTSCIKNIDIKFNEENIYDLDYVLLDEKINLDALLDLSNSITKDLDNNTLYKLENIDILVCNNNGVILGNKITLEEGYCEIEKDNSV